MLERELDNLRGNQKSKSTVIISDRGDGFIPEFYIPQEDVRVTVYRRLMNVLNLNELNDMLSEIQDRFGKLPDEMKFLGSLIAVRNFGADFGITRVEIKNGIVKITCPNELGFSSEKNLKPEMKNYISNLGRRFIFV